MGGLRRSPPWPVLAFALWAWATLTEGPHTALKGRIRCKQQRIYKRFTSIAARPSPNEKSRPEAAHVVAFNLRRDGERHVALM
jgi:hypothetical protein